MTIPQLFLGINIAYFYWSRYSTRLPTDGDLLLKIMFTEIRIVNFQGSAGIWCTVFKGHLVEFLMIDMKLNNLVFYS